MFVKIDYNGSCNWIECDYVQTTLRGGVDEEKRPHSIQAIHIYKNDCEVPIQCREIDLTKETRPGVYLLNNHGETIDVIVRAVRTYSSG